MPVKEKYVKLIKYEVNSVISPEEKSGGVKKLRDVIIDSKGIIVTNAHIIKNAQRIRVILGVRENEDLGFIVINKSTLPPLEFSDINKTNFGDPVYIV